MHDPLCPIHAGLSLHDGFGSDRTHNAYLELNGRSACHEASRLGWGERVIMRWRTKGQACGADTIDEGTQWLVVRPTHGAMRAC